MKEGAQLLPVFLHGVTKLAAENLCSTGRTIASLFFSRYFTVYGPRQRPDMAINKFVDAIVDGHELDTYCNGQQLQDFSFINDVLDAFLLTAQSGVAGEVFSIGGKIRSC